MGGTLLDTGFDRDALIRHWFELARGNPDVTTKMIEECADVLIEHTQAIRREHFLEFSRGQFDRNLNTRLSTYFELNDEEIDREFVESSYRAVPRPGILSALEGLKRMNIDMAVVSNSVLGGKALTLVLERNGLMRYFRFMMTSADYGFRKPHPEIFKTALAKAKINADDSWFIGDRLDWDVKGAQNCGMKGVWYNAAGRDDRDAFPDAEIDHWDRLIELIE